MPVYCGPDCYALCDFCFYLPPVAVGRQGICQRTGERVDLLDTCDEFLCAAVGRGEAAAAN